MIYVLHGENVQASYARLLEVVSLNKSAVKIHIESNSLEDLAREIYSLDLFTAQKIFIAQDFITKKKLKPQLLNEDINTHILILWEKKELTKTQVNAFAKIAKIELFKLPANIFYFLDSIPSSRASVIKFLNAVSSKDDSLLLWHLQSRFFLLNLAVLGINGNLASRINGKAIQPWQWDKIKEQAKKMGPMQVRQLFQSALKIDFMIKTGATNIPVRSLVSMMLFKYLPV